MSKVLKVGTDCSGIEAPIQALLKLKVPFSHEFSCEIDQYARQSIEANYKPKLRFKDITKKRKLPTDLDIYVAGFPCQPFSTVGYRRGGEDPRGNIFLHCIKAIKQTNTNTFILENVRGIISVENGTYWKKVLKILNGLKDYNIYWKLLNTKDYGIPQNRERVFIIGIKKIKEKIPFTFPKKKKMKDVWSYIDKSKKNSRLKINMQEKYMEKVRKSKAPFISFAFLNNIKPESYIKYTPTMLAQHGLWCVPMKRKATIKEMLSLQGFPKNFKQVVSDTQMQKQIGNSMSVNVLVELFKEIFKSIGYKYK